MMKILITGTAGFIGFHLAKKLLESGYDVVGLDNINDYYDVELKYARLTETGINRNDIAYNQLVQSSKYPAYRFIQLNLQDKELLLELFAKEKFDGVVNLAAQAGVRYSITNPYVYIESNVVGFMNILEGCRYHGVGHLVYASTSSVYGLNTKMPLSEDHPTEHPITLYAATKKANEMMAHSYSYLYNLPTTGLRFFTVYGPWGRPDMALFKFTKAILKGEPIDVYNEGKMVRDFTYVDDIVSGIQLTLESVPTANPGWDGADPVSSQSSAPYRIYNIGNSKPIKLIDYVHYIEKILGKKAALNLMPMQLGDVPATWADISALTEDVNYSPKTTVNAGVKHFIDWYLKYYE